MSTTSCSAAEIAEKKRIALEKLRLKKAQLQVSNTKPTVATATAANKVTSTSTAQSKAAPSASALAFLNKLKHSSIFQNQHEARDAAHPYKRSLTDQEQRAVGPLLGFQPQKPLALVFGQTVSCRVNMISSTSFAVHPSGFHAQMVEVFKSIPSKSYGNKSNIWNFSVQDYPLLIHRMEALKPNVTMGAIPKAVLQLCTSTVKEINRSVLTSIEATLAEKLLPFQQEGVCTAIAHHGRIMICDEMGLGKTYQALAVADFYRDNWPLLICTTASTRETWASHVRNLLPSVPLHFIQVLSSNQQYIGDAKILITSYNMMEKVMSNLLERRFGVLIFDESHTLKNSKAKCTAVADRLSMQSKQVILLSGTPALSRPLELFTQIHMIDRKFMSFREFTSRYCDGKQTNFGWDANGQSNLEELNVLLKLKFMIRRTKADVLPELAEKIRETIVLDPALIWTSKESEKELNKYTKKWNDSKGKDKEAILLTFYAETAKVKARAVCAYLKTLLKENKKFIVFAHHRVMLDAITDFLNQRKVHFVRIDGSTKNETRTDFIDEFQNKSSCRVAVLSLKACNAGITLTAAETIVFAELDWNPSILAQAESRAHRIGQEKPVVCRYLMANKTADDLIWNMLNNKQNVLNQAGLFCEDLQEATHKSAPTTSYKIDHYFSPDKSRSNLSNISMNTSSEASDCATTPTSTKTKIQSNVKPAISLTQELANIDDIFKDEVIVGEPDVNKAMNVNVSKELENIEDFFNDDDAFNDLNF